MNQIANLCAVSAEELIHEIAILGRDALLGPNSLAGPDQATAAATTSPSNP
jgi:hypothetical protein